MNQILSVNMPNNRTKSKPKKANIRSIIIFFCVITLIFAIIVVGVGVYLATNKSDDEVQSNVNNNNTNNNIITGSQPQINVEIDDSQSKLNIIITHDKQISSVSYRWNDGEPTQETNIGQNNYELQIDTLLGTNTLNIEVTDIDGVTQSFSEEYTGTGPGLMLEESGNQIKVTAQSDAIISYISYNWDGGEEQIIQVNDVTTEQYIDVIEGSHTLNVLAVDREGNEMTQSKTTLGDYPPTLDVQADNDNFYINAQDDEGVEKITINLNDQDLDDIILNGEKQYQTQIPLQQGENRLIITVYYTNGLNNEQRVRTFKQ